MDLVNPNTLVYHRSASEELERGDKASRRAAMREAQRAKERAERAAREQRRLGVEDLQVPKRTPCSLETRVSRSAPPSAMAAL